MSNIPACGHPQCAGEAFCGYTGQPLTAAPVRKGGAGKVFLLAGGVIVCVAALWFGRHLLFDRAAPAYQATQPRNLPSQDKEIRFPGWTASLPVEAITVPDNGFDELGLEPVVGRFINSADLAADPPVVVIREELAEVVQRGVRELSQTLPDRAPPVPNSQDFVGREIELSGRRMVIAGVAGRRPVTSSSFRAGFSTETSKVYVPGPPRP
jgi:hypothetical protein